MICCDEIQPIEWHAGVLSGQSQECIIVVPQVSLFACSFKHV